MEEANVEEEDIKEKGARLALKLRKMTETSSRIMKKFLIVFVTISPHNIATERAE